MDAVRQVRDALISGQLTPDKLTARALGAFLGKTTSVLYHHWGSLDGFLFAVSESGFELLREALYAELDRGGELPEMAEAFVRFGLGHPALYALMFERRYPWDELRAAGTFDTAQPSKELWLLLVTRLAETGARHPDDDARLLYAGLHGLVSLALSGRANVGILSVTDDAVAVEAARTLARRLCRRRKREETHA